MIKCPYCRSPLDTKRLPDFTVLSNRRRRIMRAIVMAGPDGLKRSTLMERFFRRHSKTTVRTTINAINIAIKPLRIVSRSKILRLVYEDIPSGKSEHHAPESKPDKEPDSGQSLLVGGYVRHE